MNDIFTKLFALLYFSGLIILSYSRVSCVLNRIAINITENRNSIIIIDNTFFVHHVGSLFYGDYNNVHESLLILNICY